jgi:hypothetical protein
MDKRRRKLKKTEKVSKVWRRIAKKRVEEKKSNEKIL